MRSLHVIVLAAQRSGVIDPLAARFGVSHKCLVPLHGQPLIAHVLKTVACHPCVDSVTISIESEAFDTVSAIVPGVARAHAAIRFSQAADNIADSVKLASRGQDGPLIITTADNVMLSPASIDTMLAALLVHDVALAMAPRELVMAAHPDGQRRFYDFKDGQYSNCNLYGLAGPRALDAAEIFRGGGQFSKKIGRVIRAFGLLNMLLLRLRVVSLPQGLERIARRVGLSIAPVILSDGTQAIDVDNDRTYGVAESLLEQRRAA